MKTVRAPLHWAHARLDEVAEVRLGRQRSPQRATGPNMVPYLRAANVTWRGIDLGDVKEMDFTPAELETYRLLAGDILLAEASGSPSEVGKPAIYAAGAVTHCFQNTLIRVRSPAGLTPFLHLHFLKDALLGSFGKASRGVGIHHLGAEALSAWQVSIPPLGEQERLTDAVDSYLSRLDAAVASLERAQAKLKAYRASVLKAAVEGRLVPTEAELARKENRSYEPATALLARILEERRRRWERAELAKLEAAGKTQKDDRWKAKYEEPAPLDASKLPDLPEGWCWATVDQLSFDVFYGSSAKTSSVGDVPVLRMGNIVEGGLRTADLKYLPATHAEFPALLLEPGDLLFNRTNSADLVGKTAVYRGAPAPCSFASYLICARLVQGVESQWIAHAINSPYGRFWVSDVVVQQVGQANVNGTKLKAFAVPLPPADEQIRLLNLIDILFSNADESGRAMSRELLRLSRLRQAILKWAFEGKLVDQDPTDEPADRLLARIRAERAATAPAKKTRGRKAKATP